MPTPISPAHFYDPNTTISATYENAGTLTSAFLPAGNSHPKGNVPALQPPAVSAKAWTGARYLDLVHAANDANIFGAAYKEKGSTWAKIGASLRAKGLDHSDQVFRTTLSSLLQYHAVSNYLIYSSEQDKISVS
jgi:hypothetical protein